MSKSWFIGDWAAEAERAEEEEKALAAAAAAAAASAPQQEAFPTLGESLSMRPRKKKQQHTFSISEFTIGRSVSHGTRTRDMAESRGLTVQEMMILPTGPSDRSGEQDQYGGIGGAFRDYRGGGVYQGGSDRLNGGQTSGGRHEHDRAASGFLHDRERDGPSRADVSRDWSSSKRVSFPQTGGHGGERRSLPEGERRGPGNGNPDLPPSRADGVDNWGLVKRSLPLASTETWPSSRNIDVKQTLRADEMETWTSSKKTAAPPVIDVPHVQSRADEAADWLSSKRLSMGLHANESMATGDRARTMLHHQQEPQDLQRRPIVLAPQGQSLSSPSPASLMNADGSTTLPPLVPKPKSNPFGSARPREEVLASRGPDDQSQSGTKERDSRPSSSHSSRPNTPEVSVEPDVKPRPKVNPFGNAKPREVLLQERGKDWRKMDFDLQHRGVDRPETQEEITLREEIRVLTELSKQELESSPQGINGYVRPVPIRQDAGFKELHIKERQLQELTTALDDKVRFSQKFAGHTGIHFGRNDIGRSSEVPERSGSRPSSRPGSRSGRSDVGSNYDPTERDESRRNFDASDRTNSLSEYGSWSRTGQVVNSRDVTGRQEAPDRMGSWSGRKENRGFEPLQRSDWQSVQEVGVAVKYFPQAGGRDRWANSDVGSQDRPTGWRGQERGQYKDGMRRF